VSNAIVQDQAAVPLLGVRGALDALTRRKMQKDRLELWNETHFTVMFVTHLRERA
jgi:ABC-type nitrate/sulfonate/bicarbonate transport system ATPase subunit